MKTKIHPTQNKQHGAVLLVALMLLLLLTIIGLVSMRSTSLQENMAGNLRENNLSFQAAEAGLRAGENKARSKFMDGSLNILQPMAKVSGAHAESLGVVQNPTFDITKLASLRTSTEAGVSMDDEGVLVRIDSQGVGATKDDTNNPISFVQLRSTYLIEQ